jgi:hypothetical protein
LTLSLLGIGADTSIASASVRLAASHETVRTVLEETCSRSTLANGKISGSSLRSDSGSCLGLPLMATYSRVGNDRRFRLSDKDKIASLGGKVSAPLLVARVFGAVSTEAILAADVVLD